MQIFVNGSKKELDLINPENGANWISDFIGNTGAFEDGTFTYDEEKDAYIVSQDDYEWWEGIVRQQEELDERIYELKQEHGSEAVSEVVKDAADTDLEDRASAINAALDEAYGKAEGDRN